MLCKFCGKDFFNLNYFISILQFFVEQENSKPVFLNLLLLQLLCSAFVGQCNSSNYMYMKSFWRNTVFSYFYICPVTLLDAHIKHDQQHLYICKNSSTVIYDSFRCKHIVVHFVRQSMNLF